MMMKDGYYLSAYFEISKFGNLYCYSLRHDNSVALWHKDNQKVSLVHYWELERMSGIKQQRIAFYDKEHCYQILNHLLSNYNLTVNDMTEIWGVPELWEDDSYLSKHRFGEYTYHNICHLASSLFLDTDLYKKEKILAFTIDAGSDTVVNNYIKDPTEKKELEKIQYAGWYSQGPQAPPNIFPVLTPAVLWSICSIHYFMREGSLMALASASESKTFLEFEDILKTTNDQVNSKIYGMIDQIINTIHSFTQEDAGKKFNYFDPRFSEEDNKTSMVMKVIQDMSYRIMERNIDSAIREYNIIPEETYLAMSGGFALNCPCNTYLMKKYGFKGFIAPPCVSDSGMALGIGLYSFYDKTNGEFDFKFQNAYYGDSDDMEKFLQENKYEHYLESVTEFDARQVVEDIEKEPVIWFDGQAEVGPRALGARSLIGDPRKQETKDQLNEIKLRQWWRPVAPIILREEISNWFEDDFESPYMLHALRIKEDKSAQVPAIVHEDFTARLQSIAEGNGQERLYQVIKAFYEKTGVPIICNTSLNDKAEPIINRIEEGINFALRKGIRIGYFNGKRIVFKNHADYKETQPLIRPLRMVVWKNQEDRVKYLKENGIADIPDTVAFYRLMYSWDFIDLVTTKDSKTLHKILAQTKYYMNNEHKLSKSKFKIRFMQSDDLIKMYI